MSDDFRQDLDASINLLLHPPVAFTKLDPQKHPNCIPWSEFKDQLKLQARMWDEMDLLRQLQKDGFLHLSENNTHIIPDTRLKDFTPDDGYMARELQRKRTSGQVYPQPVVVAPNQQIYQHFGDNYGGNTMPFNSGQYAHGQTTTPEETSKRGKKATIWSKYWWAFVVPLVTGLILLVVERFWSTNKSSIQGTSATSTHQQAAADSITTEIEPPSQGVPNAESADVQPDKIGSAISNESTISIPKFKERHNLTVWSLEDARIIVDDSLEVLATFSMDLLEGRHHIVVENDHWTYSSNLYLSKDEKLAIDTSKMKKRTP